ncbi:hypothetical protein scyTo_0020962, partial [Scyliorhinus torazame]|nr:hypothetical protein [Scyliorhinus torazame]
LYKKKFYITMTTECAWSPEEADDRLDNSDQLCKHLGVIVQGAEVAE